MALVPNQTVAYPQVTQGICRRLDAATIATVALSPQAEGNAALQAVSS
jgi:hypothetical protein